jgi:hypothetical protein
MRFAQLVTGHEGNTWLEDVQHTPGGFTHQRVEPPWRWKALCNGGVRSDTLLLRVYGVSHGLAIIVNISLSALPTGVLVPEYLFDLRAARPVPTLLHHR